MQHASIPFKGMPAHQLCAGNLQLIVTDFGAKIQSIRYFGREYLWQNTSGSVYRKSAYGGDFKAGEFSGFDDMFPNITAGPYPDGRWQGVQLPDHGEVWSRDWQAVIEPDVLCFSIDGVALPYQLEKRLWLENDTIRLQYCAQNHSDFEMKCIWAAHPLFVLEDGMQLDLPHCATVMNVYGGRKALGAYGDVHPWPLSGDRRDLQTLSAANKTSNKYYVLDSMPENLSALHYPSGVAVTLRAPAAQVPYLGVWTDEDGEDMRCVAPEPCTGAFDTLEAANARQAVAVIPPQGQSTWSLRIEWTGGQRK